MKKTIKLITIIISLFLMMSLCATSVPVKAANETENTSSQEEKNETTSETKSKKTTNGKFTDASGTMYIKSSVNFRESDTTQSESYGRVPGGEEVTILGKGDNGWYKVEYDGKTGYIKGTYLTSTNPNKEEENVTEETGTEKEPMEDDIFGLDELSIEDVTLTPEFKKGVYEYTGTLTKDLTKLNVNAVCNTEGSKIDISGNQDIKEGENVITVIVTGNDKGKNQTLTYQITVTKDLSAQQAAAIADMENAQKELNKKIWLVRGGIAVLVFAVIVYLIIRYRSQDNVTTATEFSVPYESLSNQSDEDDRDYREEYLNQFSKKEQQDPEIPKALQEDETEENDFERPVEDITDQQTRKFNIEDLEDFDSSRRERRGKGKHF